MSSNTNHHSWFDRRCHIFRNGGKKFVKCKIGSLQMGPGYVALLVHFKEGNKDKKKLISPITLVALQGHWLSCDFVSEDEEDLSEHEIVDQVVHNTTTDELKGVFELLPLFELTKPCEHTAAQHEIISFITNQTNAFSVMSI